MLISCGWASIFQLKSNNNIIISLASRMYDLLLYNWMGKCRSFLLTTKPAKHKKISIQVEWRIDDRNLIAITFLEERSIMNITGSSFHLAI
jgi:hypothetical protein